MCCSNKNVPVLDIVYTFYEFLKVGGDLLFDKIPDCHAHHFVILVEIELIGMHHDVVESCFFRTRFCTLPVGVIGSSSTKVTALGIL